MNDYNRRNRPRPPFGFDLDEFFNANTWTTLEKKITGAVSDVLAGISIKKVEGKLHAILDVPGVSKENVKVRFEDLAAGFTRLTVTTSRDGTEKIFKSEFREKVDASAATASVKLGVLTITVPIRTDDVEKTTEVPVK